MSTGPSLPAAPFALFDDSLSAPDEARSLLLEDLQQIIVASDAAGVDAALARIEAAAAAGSWLALDADYELGYWIEPQVLRVPYASRWPALRAHVFRRGSWLDGHQVARLLAAHEEALPAAQRHCGVAGIEPAIDEASYLAAIRRILAYIHNGDCYQANFTFALDFRHYGDSLALYAKLRRAQPVCHGAYLSLPGRTVLSLSPELFVERRGGRLTVRPMKGTAPRGSDAAADTKIRDELAACAKNRAENLMIVDLIRNDLGRIARTGSVRVDRMFDVEPYRTLWQMTSTVSAEAPSRSLAEIFRALFPCGSVTGAPKVRAMQVIAELEAAPRGLYCGALGYLLPGGDFSFNVPIRTLVLDDDGAGTLGIGSGIVADSDPATELAECLLKARFVSELQADFELIETLLLDPGHPGLYPLLDDHMQRLGASARYFSFRFDAAHACAALLAHGRGVSGAGRQRTRLTLGKEGRMVIQSTPLPAAASAIEPLVVLARQSIDSRDLFRYHKTTVRREYEAELARLETRPDVADALFCNERGELCEGARSNLFLAFADVLHTPPLTAGVLDGVMRRRLLREQASIVERTLYPDDLRRADAIYISNAVRGLRRVRLVEPVLNEDAPEATCLLGS